MCSRRQSILSRGTDRGEGQGKNSVDINEDHEKYMKREKTECCEDVVRKERFGGWRTRQIEYIRWRRSGRGVKREEHTCMGNRWQ